MAYTPLLSLFSLAGRHNLKGTGFQGSGCRVRGFGVQGTGFQVQGVGYRGAGYLGSGVQGAGCRVLGFRVQVQGSGLRQSPPLPPGGNTRSTVDTVMPVRQ